LALRLTLSRVDAEPQPPSAGSANAQGGSRLPKFGFHSSGAAAGGPGRCRINPRRLPGSVLRVGSENGHLVRRGRAVGREVAAHGCSRGRTPALTDASGRCTAAASSSGHVAVRLERDGVLGNGLEVQLCAGLRWAG
jgi:hypothetical protein